MRYSLPIVKRELKVFFTDNTHWAYSYGSKSTSCNKDTVFYKKQTEVLFEERYPHDVTSRAIDELVHDGFLKAFPSSYGNNMHAIFVCRRRFVARIIKEKLAIMERYSSDEINDGAGKYAEILFRHMFEKNQFEILGNDTQTYEGKTWTHSGKNLDYIVKRDGLAYGVEIKNRFDYMDEDEFEEKLAMCRFLGLAPLFPLRCPSDQQYALMKTVNGLALKFKTRVFPPGNQKLVTEIWNHFRLPVNVWEQIPPPVEHIFLSHHRRLLSAEP